MNDPIPNKALAALFAALVEALDEKAPGLALSFARHLDEAQVRLKDGDSDDQGVGRTLSWTKTLLRDDLDRAEPACVVYAKTWAPEEDQLPSSGKIQLATLDEAVRFWSRLPAFDREHASVETASGHRFDAPALANLARRYKERPPV